MPCPLIVSVIHMYQYFIHSTDISISCPYTCVLSTDIKISPTVYTTYIIYPQTAISYSVYLSSSTYEYPFFLQCTQNNTVTEMSISSAVQLYPLTIDISMACTVLSIIHRYTVCMYPTRNITMIHTVPLSVRQCYLTSKEYRASPTTLQCVRTSI